MPQDTPKTGKGRHFSRHILIGILTVAPLWVTWLVFDILFGILARTGAPLLRAGARAVRPFSELAADWLSDPRFHYVLAILLTLAALYGIGLFARAVMGRILINHLEKLVMRIPLADSIYKTTKRFLDTLGSTPSLGNRVVLIPFPSERMRVVGFLTRTFRDTTTGRELGAVYVPTSPNPTSGYVEIVPIRDVVPTDWTIEEAMAFIFTGGANAPDRLDFDAPQPGAPEADAPRANVPEADAPQKPPGS